MNLQRLCARRQAKRRPGLRPAIVHQHLLDRDRGQSGFWGGAPDRCEPPPGSSGTRGFRRRTTLRAPRRRCIRRSSSRRPSRRRRAKASPAARRRPRRALVWRPGRSRGWSSSRRRPLPSSTMRWITSSKSPWLPRDGDEAPVLHPAESASIRPDPEAPLGILVEREDEVVREAVLGGEVREAAVLQPVEPSSPGADPQAARRGPRRSRSRVSCDRPSLV